MQNDSRILKTPTHSAGGRFVFVVEGAAESDSMEALASAIQDVDRETRAVQALIS